MVEHLWHADTQPCYDHFPGLPRLVDVNEFPCLRQLANVNEFPVYRGYLVVPKGLWSFQFWTDLHAADDQPAVSQWCKQVIENYSNEIFLPGYR